MRNSIMKKANSERKSRSVTERKSQAQICSAWLCKKVLHFCPRGLAVRTGLMYFWMVRLQTRMPSLSHSPRIRSAPQSRLLLAISLINATVSAGIFGLAEAALDLYFQYSLNPWRCHRRSVSGWKMKSACFQVRTILASRTRSIRSARVHAGRFTCRRRMMSCWRRSAFSATSSDFLLVRSVNVPKMRELVAGFVHLRKWGLSA